LFNITPATLCNRLKTIYVKVTNVAPPLGLGVHTCRYLMAMIMTKNSKNLAHVQHWLQHKSIRTTQRYVHVDQTYTKEAFDRITRLSFASLRADLTGESSLPTTDSENYTRNVESEVNDNSIVTQTNIHNDIANTDNTIVN